MSGFAKILTFRSNDLGKDSILVLTFDDSKIPGIYETVFPTASKVCALGETGLSEFTFTYYSDLGFTRALVSSGIVVPAGTYTRISAGQKTILTKEEGNPSIYSFSAQTPESIRPPTNQMVAYNDTNKAETIGVGFFTRLDRQPTQTLVFERVDPGSLVQCEFTPILGGYIISGHKENAVLRGQIATPLLFKENLVELPAYTNWRIEYENGEYKITRDFMDVGEDA